MTYDKNLTRIKNWVNVDKAPVDVYGLSGAAQSYFFAQFLADLKRPCLVIAFETKMAERLFKELQFFMSESPAHWSPGNGRLYVLPPYDISPLTGLSPHVEVVTRRVEAFYRLMTKENPVIITSLEAICFRILPKEALVKALEYLEYELNITGF